MENHITLLEFKELNKAHSQKMYNEDLVALFVPLFKKLTNIYDENKVANLRELDNLLVFDREIHLKEDSFIESKSNLSELKKLTQNRHGIFEVTDRTIAETNVGSGNSNYHSGEFVSDDSEIKHPVFVLGYKSYEQRFGHYDQKTELFICGLLMASFAFDLDFNKKDDVEKFVRNRDSLYFLNKDLHPTLLLIISNLTQLNRDKRIRETRNLVWKLENYKDYSTDHEVDILGTEGFIKQKADTRNQWVLNHLKGRLFDISRRNKLLYFKSSSKFLNLTIASVPTVLYYENIKEKDLFLWHKQISSQIKEGGKINLTKYLKFDEAGYIKSNLDNIRSIARKDLYEYGFSQLKLVIAYLNWYNFKENKGEKIKSPLIIVPVKLVKKTGVDDSYFLQFNSTQAEINPVLTHYLKDLYDIDLPEFIDLEKIDLLDFYQKLKQIIDARSHGIDLVLRDRPKIKLIQSIAKQQVVRYNKRTRYQTTEFNISQYNYSYKRENYSPLGVKIFKDRIVPSSSYLQFLIDEDIELRTYNFADEKSRSLYQIDKEGETNPYRWEFDLCNFTLGNFNYKKMSLVRDYNLILKQKEENKVFNYLFSDEPKKITDSNEKLASFEDNFYVLNADATQARAISKAKTGDSIIIQGPPGTGKSQTITNLIADYASRGKKILFVCEKRAALDVVYSRLKQNNIHLLASLVHDSQEDKKAFIMDAKKTYEFFVDKPDHFNRLSKKRDALITEMKQELLKIEGFHKILKDVYPQIGIQLIDFIERLIQMNEVYADNTLNATDDINYKIWQEASETLKNFSKGLMSIGKDEALGKYSLIGVKKSMLNNDVPAESIKNNIDKIIALTDEWQELAELNNVEEELKLSINKFSTCSSSAKFVLELNEISQQGVLKEGSLQAQQLTKIHQELLFAKAAWEKTVEENSNWKKKLSPLETQTVLEKMQKLEGKFYAFLIPTYHKYKKLLQGSYNFNKHAVKPKMTLVLEQLKEEHTKEDAYNGLVTKANQIYNTTDFIKTKQKIEDIRLDKNNYVHTLKDYDKDALSTLSKMNEELQVVIDDMVSLGVRTNEESMFDCSNRLLEMKKDINTLPVILPYLKSFIALNESVKEQIRSNDKSLAENEFSVAHNSIQEIYNQNIEVVNAAGHSLKYSVDKIHKIHNEILDLNGDYLLEAYKSKFKEELHNSTLLARQQSPEQKENKKLFNASRRILENEFNKKIRYKSIRDLKSLESSYILDMLKPIWLMSPLSVSDTLPVDSKAFDVVIFDEASQITLEEGVPTLFRSNQAIIVGDEMQMPPTNFFSSSSAIQKEIEDEDDGERVVIDADSMLTHATKKLEDVMLSWHYRSRYENLIGFSNSAFYNGDLLTIPDREINHFNITETDSISDRINNEIISFHFQEDGIYHKRQNNVEAKYVAEMVRELLIHQPDKSIGIVAFSMQQQDNIEQALARLSQEDKNFYKLLEDAYTREEDEQHVGLFVKNLENVQGDERDIIIISVCYGYNEKGKMLMNFGPINRKGGEKRLNVIFSRAKKHMAIVSSIKYFDIKNEYNEGANYLRRFLEYAENLSVGKQDLAEQVLGSLAPHKTEEKSALKGDVVVNQLSDYIQSLGYKTQQNVGLSDFKISIGVIDKENQNKYCLGIMVDSKRAYQDNNILDKYVLRPHLLNSFNWKTIKVYKKDWLERPDLIKEQIQKILEGNKFEPKKVLKNELKAEKVITEEKPTNIPKEEKKVEENITKLSYKKDSSDKFWNIKQDENCLIITFGRTGTTGREVTKEYDSSDIARYEMNKLIDAKKKKGYENS